MIDDIRSAIYTALSGNATLTGLVGTNIYHLYVPQGIAYPYVIFFYAAGGDTNDTPTPNFDVTYTVKIVSNDAAAVESGFDAIREALHEADLGAVGSLKPYRCQMTTFINFVEQIERTQIYHAGANVRIRAIGV